MQPKPIFVIGNPRSGTTLLRLILHAHSNIVAPPEGGFAMWLYQKYKHYNPSQLDSFLSDMKKTKKIENWNIDWKLLKKSLLMENPLCYSELINNIYLFYGKTKGKEANRWGDKNNFYLNYISEIKELFPQAYFIHIIRDGRNVACSYIRLNKIKKIHSNYAPKLPNDIEQIANEWNNNLNIIRNSFKEINYERVIEIRLEDLTANPKVNIKKIMNFIGEQFNDNLLEYYKIKEAEGGEPAHFLEWKDKSKKPIQTEQYDKYKNILNSDEIFKFIQIAKTNLKHYHYL